MNQWLAVAGLGLDIVGFLLVIREWYLAFASHRRALVAQLMRDSHETAQIEGFDPVNLSLESIQKDLNDWPRRLRFVFVGVALVILGFAGQLSGVLVGIIAGH